MLENLEREWVIQKHHGQNTMAKPWKGVSEWVSEWVKGSEWDDMRAVKVARLTAKTYAT